MSSGSFRSVFDYCTSIVAGLEKVFFDELYEQGLRVCFDALGHIQFQAMRGQGRNDMLERAGAEFKQSIFYRSVQAIRQGFSTIHEYQQQFGDPVHGTT